MELERQNWRLMALATKGCRGVVLETICIGGSRCTSAESLQRFFDAVTVAKGSAGVVLEAGVGGSAMPVREVGDVDAILRRAGILETGDEGGR
jgi:hypothetical protein